MCRLLFVHSKEPFAPEELRRPFAELSRSSREYQGHGWGCAYLQNGKWQRYRTVKPVWEDDVSHLPQVHTAIYHARSAFRNQDIAEENNMPFLNHTLAFAFNGELHGVRLSAPGRIGAEKLFHFILQNMNGNPEASFQRSLDVILKQTRYVRALNLVLADDRRLFLASHFNEAPDYFTLHRKQVNGKLLICSEPFPGETDWQPIPNQTREVVNYADH